MSKRLSPEAKRTRGTARPDRSIKSTAVDRFKEPPAPPQGLSDRAKQEWLELARVTTELGVLTSADLRALALLAETLATEGELREVLRREGLTILGANENSKAHPACRLMESTRNQAMRLLADFGLTPRGRLGVDIRPPAFANRFSMNGASLEEKYFTGAKPWEGKVSS